MNGLTVNSQAFLQVHLLCARQVTDTYSQIHDRRHVVIEWVCGALLALLKSVRTTLVETTPMHTAYLLILTMFSGVGEIIDPQPHHSLASCQSELETMKEAVNREWSVHGILRMKGECRDASNGTVVAEVVSDHWWSINLIS